MTKKNLRPQQVAPVQREINATSASRQGEKGMGPSILGGLFVPVPFAGDDAE